MVEVIAKALEETVEATAKSGMEGTDSIKPDSEYNPDKPIETEGKEEKSIDVADRSIGSEEIKPDSDYNPDKPIYAEDKQMSSKEEIPNDIVKQTDVQDIQEKKGGSYAEVKKNSDGTTHEVHHMPADSVSELSRNDGPAIKMEKEDHKITASNGPSREACEYRQMQKELIENGKFDEAIQMDIDDIHEKFGDKYDDAIAEMKDYIDKLKEEGRV